MSHVYGLPPGTRLIGWVFPATHVVWLWVLRGLWVANHFVMSGKGHSMMVLWVVVRGVLSCVKKENSSSSRVVVTSVRCQNLSSDQFWGVVVAFGLLVHVMGSSNHFSKVVCVICVARFASWMRTPCCHTVTQMWWECFGRCLRNSRGFWEGEDWYSFSSESYSYLCCGSEFIVVVVLGWVVWGVGGSFLCWG